jgi:hypothetical protein
MDPGLGSREIDFGDQPADIKLDTGLTGATTPKAGGNRAAQLGDRTLKPNPSKPGVVAAVPAKPVNLGGRGNENPVSAPIPKVGVQTHQEGVPGSKKAVGNTPKPPAPVQPQGVLGKVKGLFGFNKSANAEPVKQQNTTGSNTQPPKKPNANPGPNEAQTKLSRLAQSTGIRTQKSLGAAPVQTQEHAGMEPLAKNPAGGDFDAVFACLNGGLGKSCGKPHEMSKSELPNLLRQLAELAKSED